MRYEWRTYTADDAATVDSWMDADARYFTGCEDGWDAYIAAMLCEDYIRAGENFWSTLIFEAHQPIAAAALYLAEDGTLRISEMVVKPQMRGQGHGRAVLQELLCHTDAILGCTIRGAEAVIYPNNQASIHAFEAAEFHFSHAHPDGDACYYKYDIPNLKK